MPDGNSNGSELVVEGGGSAGAGAIVEGADAPAGIGRLVAGSSQEDEQDSPRFGNDSMDHASRKMGDDDEDTDEDEDEDEETLETSTATGGQAGARPLARASARAGPRSLAVASPEARRGQSDLKVHATAPTGMLPRTGSMVARRIQQALEGAGISGGSRGGHAMGSQAALGSGPTLSSSSSSSSAAAGRPAVSNSLLRLGALHGSAAGRSRKAQPRSLGPRGQSSRSQRMLRAGKRAAAATAAAAGAGIAGGKRSRGHAGDKGTPGWKVSKRARVH